MSRFAFIGVLLASGCFYTDVINQRPSIVIVADSADTVHRGDMVKLHATFNDPDGQFVTFTWHVQACIDATDVTTCDPVFHTTIDDRTTIPVPVFLADNTPVQSLRVVLEGHDDHGATAKPPQVLVIPVEDKPPDLALSQDSRHGFVVNAPIDLFAKVGDADDGPQHVALAWVVFSPPEQPAYTIYPIAVSQDPNDTKHIQSGMRFTPTGLGKWDVQVTATDTLGMATVKHLTIQVVADHPPCIAQVSPIVPPVGQTLTVYDPTLFQVLVVADDLDGYPTIPNDPISGTATFRWSLLPPGATTRQLLTVTSSGVAIDPASYTPGDIIELRVEIEDRNHTAITCAPGNPTCSVISDPACIQRQTWRMELR